MNHPQMHPQAKAALLASLTPEMRRAVLQEYELRKDYVDGEPDLHACTEVVPLFYSAELYRELHWFTMSLANWFRKAALKEPLFLLLEGGEPSLKDIQEAEAFGSAIGLALLYDPLCPGYSLTYLTRLSADMRAWAGERPNRLRMAHHVTSLIYLLKEDEAAKSTGSPLSLRGESIDSSNENAASACSSSSSRPPGSTLKSGA